MSELNTFITQSLSPALAISATGMLALGMHHRMTVLGSRIRELNKGIAAETDPARIANYRQQIGMFLKRGFLIRNALFLLYTALGLMVLTAVALALTELTVFQRDWFVPIVTFLLGLFLILAAVVIESFEVLLMLKALRMDISAADPLEPQT